MHLSHVVLEVKQCISLRNEQVLSSKSLKREEAADVLKIESKPKKRERKSS